MVKKLHLLVTYFLLLAFATSSLARVWTDRDGKKTSGTFIRINGGDVEIVATDGKAVKIPFTSLVPADQQYLRNFLESKGQGDLLPPPDSGGGASRFFDPRTWTDLDGKTYKGKFASLNGGSVVITDAGGNSRIPFANLVRPDQEVVRKNLEAKGQGESTPPVAGDAPNQRSRRWTDELGSSFFAKYRTVQRLDYDGVEKPTVILQGADATILLLYGDLNDADRAHVLRDLQTRNLEHLVADNSSTPDTPPVRPPVASGSRTWRNTDGVPFQGSFERIVTNVVTIRSATGLINVNCETLTYDDQRFIVTELTGRDPPPAGREYRVWTYTRSTGRLQAVARFERIFGQSVQLKQQTHVFVVPFEQLTSANQDYIRRLMEAEGMGDLVPQVGNSSPEPTTNIPPVTPPVTTTAPSSSTKDWPVGRPKPPRTRTWVDRQGSEWIAEYYDVSMDGNVSFSNNTQGTFAVHFHDLSDDDQQFIRRTMANPILPKEEKQEQEEDEESFLESLGVETYHPPLWAYYIFFASMVILVLAIIAKVVERMMNSDAG